MDTGIALANTEAFPVDLIVTVLDDSGSPIASGRAMTLQPREQFAEFLNEQRLDLNLPEVFQGSLWIEATGKLAATAIVQSPGCLTTLAPASRVQ